MPATALAFMFAARLLASTASTDTPPIDYSAAYGECTNAMHASVAEALAKCEQPALAGVPGAQYAMGALLTNRNSGEDMTRGIEWLEKAVAAGSPPAAYHLATLLAESKDEASISRGRELFKIAVCAGYPAALSALAKAGGSTDTMSCASSPEIDFSGDWSISLKWDKAAPAGATTESYRVSINAGRVSVYIQVNGKWVEVKPGRFTFAQQDQTVTVAATDTGWDFDGKWIESWTIQLMRTGTDQASVAYLRTVNNPFLPARFKWRTFATFAEGSARRIKQ
jgi:hypothetical protein